jgi:hypothetical protein
MSLAQATTSAQLLLMCTPAPNSCRTSSNRPYACLTYGICSVTAPTSSYASIALSPCSAIAFVLQCSYDQSTAYLLAWPTKTVVSLEQLQIH